MLFLIFIIIYHGMLIIVSESSIGCATFANTLYNNLTLNFVQQFRNMLKTFLFPISPPPPQMNQWIFATIKNRKTFLILWSANGNFTNFFILSEHENQAYSFTPCAPTGVTLTRAKLSVVHWLTILHPLRENIQFFSTIHLFVNKSDNRWTW